MTEVKSARAARVPLADLEFAIVDVETTGWEPEDSAITEIGAVLLRRGEIVAEFTSLVNPGTPVPESIAELTGIDDRMLAPAPPVAAVLPGLLAFSRGCVLTAHNARFDVGFLSAACAASGLPWPGYPVVDTLRLARQLMATPDEVPDCKLGTLAGFFAAPVQPSHRALADARATAWVLRQLLRRLDGHGIGTLDDLLPWLAAREAAQEAAREAAREAAAREAEAQARETEARAGETEAQARETEARAPETQAQAPDAARETAGDAEPSAPDREARPVGCLPGSEPS
jgi:DNA polymerase-3 subunit epsilon